MSRLALLGGNPVRREPLFSWPAHDEREVQAVEEVVRSGDWGGIPGRRAQAFAADFAALHGAKYGICSVNGTTALEIALKALGVGPGDEVIVPALTFYATASAAIFLNARVVIADVDPDTYAISPDAVEKLITDRTAAIMPVHLYGSIADLSAILDLARRHNVLVVEDCAHMHGGRWRGRGVGSWGDAAGFSLQQSKAMTSGEGGITLTNDGAVNEVCHSLINCGRFREGDVIRKEVLGWNYRITELQATILRVQLERLPEQNERKRANAERLENRLRELPGIELLTVYEGVTARAFYCYALKYVGAEQTGVSRQRFCEAVRAEGIPLWPGTYPPLNRLPLYTEWEQRTARYIYGGEIDLRQYPTPNADRAAEQEAVLMPHHALLADEPGIEGVADAIEKVIENASELAKSDES